MILLQSCQPSPKPINYGVDACHFCKMTIVDQQHGAELVTDKGKVFMFDAIECMVNYLEKDASTTFQYLLVNDYESPKKLIDATTSHYLISKAIPSPMGAFLTAFDNEKIVLEMKESKGGEVFKWKDLQEHLKKEGVVRFSEREEKNE